MKNVSILTGNIQFELFRYNLMELLIIYFKCIVIVFRVACVSGGQGGGIPGPAIFFLFFS